MIKNTLPTYAIVELLIRLSQINPFIGDYKGHATYIDGVMVKTTNGSISFSEELVKKQFAHPETITNNDLIAVAALYKSTK